MAWFSRMARVVSQWSLPPTEEDVPENQTWARHVTPGTPLPESFRTVLTELGHSDLSQSYVIYAPADHWATRHTDPKIVALSGRNLDVLVMRGVTVEINRYPVQCIDHIQRGRILLDSWVTINATIDGNPQSSTIEFNTVVEALFDRLINTLRAIRAEICETRNPDFGQIQASPKFPDERGHKLARYASQSLLSGEEVVSVYLSPNEGKPVRRRGRFRGCTYVPGPYIIVLTNREVIRVHEECRLFTQQARYGAIWDFTPLW